MTALHSCPESVAASLRACALLLVLFPLSANADPEEDAIRLSNGNLINGTIVSLSGGKLEYDTNAMGTVYVDWDDIIEISTESQFELWTSEGQRIIGTLATSKSQSLLVAKGTRIDTVDWDEVTTIMPMRSSFEDRFNAKLSLGYSYNNASSVGQTSVNAEISHQDTEKLDMATGRLTTARTDDDITRSSRLSGLRIAWERGDVWANAYSLGYESNDELEVDYRASAGAGAGKFLLDSSQARSAIVMGLQAVTERFDSGEKENSIEGVLSASYQTWKNLPGDVGINSRLSLYPGLTEFGRLRGDTSIVLTWDLIDRVSLDLSVFGVYDNESRSDSNWDYGISTGVGLSY
ncbi:MAG: DUF481 domain-containing protein [Halioglobus sp.]